MVVTLYAFTRRTTGFTEEINITQPKMVTRVTYLYIYDPRYHGLWRGASQSVRNTAGMGFCIFTVYRLGRGVRRKPPWAPGVPELKPSKK